GSLDAAKQGAGRRPAVRDIVIAGWRTGLPHRLPELREQALRRRLFEMIHAQATQGGDRPLPWRLELCRGGLPGLRAVNKRPIYCTEVALRITKGSRQALYRSGGRIVSNEMARQLGGDVHGGRVRRGNIAEHGQCLLLTLLGICTPQNAPLSRFMTSGPKQKIAGLTLLRGA